MPCPYDRSLLSRWCGLGVKARWLRVGEVARATSHQTSFVLAQATLERLKRLRSCRARTTAVFRAVGDLGLKIHWLRVW